MAIMWPRKLPPEITSTILRSTECRVYERLRETLDDTFVVFYSRPWLGLKPDGEEIDGECDFVVAHPEYGMLAIEVKGGAVDYDPAGEKWTSKDRWECVHKIKNPIIQAKQSKYQILQKLNDSNEIGYRRIRARHGVIFPDSRNTEGKYLGADIPENLICFMEDFNYDFREWILERMGASDGYDYSEKPLGDDGIQALENILARPIHLHFPLGKIISDDDHEIGVYTQQQYQILNFIKNIPQALISGGAGTGKTILAIEEAIRLAQMGMRVLLTCYNKPLAQMIRKKTEGIDLIEVANFHELCHRYAETSGTKCPDDVSDNDLWNTVYPGIFKEVVLEEPRLQFDAIIVDEGQDFRSHWFDSLNAALNKEGYSVLRIFYDSNQSIYDFEAGFPKDISVVPLPLNRNLRNTQHICEILKCYYSGPELIAAGPQGREVEWMKVDTESDIPSVLDSVVRDLTEKEGVVPSDITILTDSRKKFGTIAPDVRCAGIICHRCDALRPNGITLDTVRRFKGLESPVVIFILSRELATDRELLYVGLSRARAQLIVIGTGKDIEYVNNCRSS